MSDGLWIVWFQIPGCLCWVAIPENRSGLPRIRLNHFFVFQGLTGILSHYRLPTFPDASQDSILHFSQFFTKAYKDFLRIQVLSLRG